ncbi:MULTISPECIES: response regulator [Brachybacterium]|uniref:response regulator n=1 Tax=Brachybacterium TaxID=43668 RepID=UPI0010CD51B9|nr:MULTISPECIES: response regulator transcription factor [Brachybacterium]MCW1805994.1 response regulator transcription factor [Brachybacterium squillarum]QCR52691.1 DNA-binding response regulator [Brachybacterium sp. SGAir0954]
MIRVVLADDQALVRKGLASLLEAEEDIEVVGVAEDGARALELIRELRPDVACLDIRMPRMNGIEVAEAIRDEDVEVLMLTTFDLDEYVFGALEAGVAGFLLKDADPEVIAHALRQVAAGRGTIDQSLTRRILREVAERRRLQPVVVRGRGAEELLTARERDILRLLAEGMSNADIGAQLHVETSTVKSHLARMLPKLGVTSRLQAVVWAYQNRVVATRP